MTGLRLALVNLQSCNGRGCCDQFGVGTQDEGFTLREMGQVLAVSYQWASELAVWEGTGGRR